MTVEGGHLPGSNRTEQGGEITRIGGQLDIVTTEGGFGFSIDGVATTPADAMVGVTASAAEVNLNDGAVAGTSVASKTLALGANKNTDILALPAGGLKIGAGAGTAVDATAAELNAAAGVTLGTVIASKNVTVDASLNTTGINNLTTTGNAALGNAAGDTFKVHGSGGSGAQSALVAAAAVGGTGATEGAYDTAAHRDELIALVNAMRTCLINHGLMAAS